MSAARHSRTLVLLILAACGGGAETTTGVPPGSTAAVVSGSGQTVVVGAAAPASLAVRVLDGSGAPVAGVPVSFTVTAGGGKVSPSTALTDGTGTATTAYTAGTAAGTQTVTAVVAGLAPLTFTFAAQPRAAYRLVKGPGDGQTGPVAQPLPVPLRVTVVDTFGNAVAGTTVSWSVPSANGTLNPATGVSDSAGVVSTQVTPTSASVVTVQASAAGLVNSPVIFSATGAIAIVLTKELAIPANYGLHDMFVRDGIAFLCAWNTGLLIYDVGGGGRGGSPSNPVFISSVVTAVNGVSGGAQVHNAWWYHAPDGQKRYVFVGQEGPGSIGTSSAGDIHVVDVSNMAAPVEVASYHLSGLGAPRDTAGVHNFWVDETNEILYAAYYNGGVVALNISGTLSGNLAGREIARVRPGGLGNTYIWGVQLEGNSLYATDMVSGFWQLRLVGGAFQVLGGGGNVPERFGSDQWVAGGYAYSGTWGTRSAPGNAVKVWQLNGTGAPVLVDSIITGGVGTVSDVEVSGDGKLLMFSTENGSGAGVYFYDLTASRSRPTFIGRYLVGTGVHTATFAQIGGRRYVFAAKDPSNPSLLILDVTGIGP